MHDIKKQFKMSNFLYDPLVTDVIALGYISEIWKRLPGWSNTTDTDIDQLRISNTVGLNVLK